MWRCWRAFFGWVEQRHGLPSPMVEMPRPRRRKVLPKTLALRQVEQLLGATAGTRHRWQWRRDRAMLLLLLDTGLRRSELAGLQPEDLRGSTVVVRGKVGEREVPLSPEVRKALVGQLPWRGRDGERLTPHGVYQVVRRCHLRAGLSGGTGPHRLRHTFGRSWIESGGDVFSLQRIMGHASIETTRIYVDLDQRSTVAQHRRYSPALAVLGRSSAAQRGPGESESVGASGGV